MRLSYSYENLYSCKVLEEEFEFTFTFPQKSTVNIFKMTLLSVKRSIDWLINSSGQKKFMKEDLKNMDITVKDAINKIDAKHYQQINDILYMPKLTGGKGMKSVKQTFKENRIIPTIKMLC